MSSEDEERQGLRARLLDAFRDLARRWIRLKNRLARRLWTPTADLPSETGGPVSYEIKVTYPTGGSVELSGKCSLERSFMLTGFMAIYEKPYYAVCVRRGGTARFRGPIAIKRDVGIGVGVFDCSICHFDSEMSGAAVAYDPGPKFGGGLVTMTRDPGRITFVGGYSEHDDDRVSWNLTHHGEVGIQSLVFAFRADSPEEKAFRIELAALFGVRWIHDAKDRECFALRSFPYNNDPIEGFEVDRRRWTRTGFARRHLPLESDLAISPLERRRLEYEYRIQAARRRIVETQEELERLGADFVNWETTP